MKLFRFFGDEDLPEYFVIASTKEEAHANLMLKLNSDIKKSAKHESTKNWWTYDFMFTPWIYPGNYQCKEYSAGEVVSPAHANDIEI